MIDFLLCFVFCFGLEYGYKGWKKEEKIVFDLMLFAAPFSLHFVALRNIYRPMNSTCASLSSIML